jgi:hypothetical protein
MNKDTAEPMWQEFFRVIGAAIVLLFMTNLHIRGQSRYHLAKKIRLEAAPGGGRYFDHIAVNVAGF